MIKTVEIKNLKVADHLSEGTLAFTASVWVNGKKVGDAKNSGRGGMTDVDLWERKGEQVRRNNELHDELAEYVRQFTWEFGQHRVDTYIDELVEKEDMRQVLKKACRGKTLLRTPDRTYEEGEYDVIPRKFTKELGEGIRTKYGKDVFILNETV